jgi:hypothetical protein
MKTVRNSIEHFSFFIFPSSFFFEREKKTLSRQQGRRKKEEGRRTPRILRVFHYAHSSDNSRMVACIACITGTDHNVVSDAFSFNFCVSSFVAQPFRWQIARSCD